MPARDPVAQRRIAGGRPVVERPRRILPRRGERAGAELLGREQVGPRNAAREGDDAHGRESSDGSGDYAPTASATSWATSVGFVPTRTPTASSASFFASAVPAEPEMIAPAWPIVFPGGAVKPAM